jgi:hypothetical protein
VPGTVHAAVDGQAREPAAYAELFAAGSVRPMIAKTFGRNTAVILQGLLTPMLVVPL